MPRVPQTLYDFQVAFMCLANVPGPRLYAWLRMIPVDALCTFLATCTLEGSMLEQVLDVCAAHYVQVRMGTARVGVPRLLTAPVL